MKVKIDSIKLLRPELRFKLDPRETQLLADDLERQGQIQPIAVKRIDNESWELVAGRRRWEAAKLCGWTEIEAFEGEYKEGILIAAAAENIRRKQLSLLEEAAYVGKLHGDGNLSVNDIAEQTGHGNSWVQDRLALLNYPQIIKDLVHGGHIRLGAAGILARITDPAQLDYLCHCAKVGGCTAQTAEAWWLDWSARQRMAGEHNYDGEMPQPIPLPDGPPAICFLCGEQHKAADMIVIRVDIDCADTVRKAREEAMRNPPPNEDTSATDGADKS